MVVFLAVGFESVLADAAFGVFAAGFAMALAAGFVGDFGTILGAGFALVTGVVFMTLADVVFGATGLGFSAGLGLSLDDPLIPRGMAIP